MFTWGVVVKVDRLEEKMLLLFRDQLGIPMWGAHLHGCLMRLRWLLEILELTPQELDAVLQSVPRLMLKSTKKHFSPLCRFYAWHGIPPLELGRLAVQCPSFLMVPIEHDMELKMAYLKSLGATTAAVVQCIRARPENFTVSFESVFREKIEFLLDAGISVEAIAVLMQCPMSVLHRPVIGNIVPKMRFLESQGISRSTFNSILIKHPFLYALDLQKTVKPFFEHLQKHGLDVNQQR